VEYSKGPESFWTFGAYSTGMSFTSCSLEDFSILAQGALINLVLSATDSHGSAQIKKTSPPP
jgi:hypothetical protein